MGNKVGTVLLDDSFDPDVPLDPMDLAMHGLVSTYFEVEAIAEPWRAEAVVRRITAEQRPFLVTVRRRIAWSVTIGAAAVIALSLLPSRESTSGTALATLLREVGYQPPIPNVGNWVDPTDVDAVADVQAAIATARIRRDQMLEIGDSGEAMFAWAKVYRNVRALGHWEEALDEMNAALAFSQEEHKRWVEAGNGGFTYLYTCLSDLGAMYELLGDYKSASEYHSQSLELALKFETWLFSIGSAVDKSPHIASRSAASTLAPRYWQLSTLAAVQGDHAAAWDYHLEAEQLLLDCFRAECGVRNIPIAADATLYHVCKAVIPNADAHVQPAIVKVRDHFVREARLHRLDRNLDAAEDYLELARTIPYQEWRDESRLDFIEPMERLRIAIARGDFKVALSAADEARQHTGSVPLFDNEGRDVSKPPICSLTRAELMFLRGVALTRMNPAEPNATVLVESANRTLTQFAVLLPEKRQKHLLARLAKQREITELLTRETKLATQRGERP